MIGDEAMNESFLPALRTMDGGRRGMSDWSRESGATGGCLCGAVRYRLNASLRQVSVCHCGQCLRWHGHAGAYTAVPKEALELLAGADQLAWYRSSDTARRGFCRSCGSSLFWQADARDHVSIATGTLDDTSGLRTVVHIFVAGKPGYYDLADDLPRHGQGGASPLVDAR
jgi:hypothetical protein